METIMKVYLVSRDNVFDDCNFATSAYDEALSQFNEWKEDIKYHIMLKECGDFPNFDSDVCIYEGEFTDKYDSCTLMISAINDDPSVLFHMIIKSWEY